MTLKLPVPSIEDLPPAPPGKVGWPWTVGGNALPETIDGRSLWPCVSIVTPSYNQGEFIEETIRSVLLQGYPNLEYMILDGGSSDNSVEIIRKYEPWLTSWVSEPDHGQSQAINKGFMKASGEVLGWLNSDDYFARGGMSTLVKLHHQHPLSVAWVGSCITISKDSTVLGEVKARTGNKKQLGNWGVDAMFQQPSCFFDARAFFEIGMLDESLHFPMDVDLWMRLVEKGEFSSTHEVISYVRIYEETKSMRDIPMRELEMMVVNFKLGQPEVARHRLYRAMTQILSRISYREVCKYFIFRTLQSLRLVPRSAIRRPFRWQ